MTTSEHGRVVVIGAGLAGALAVQTLRDEGFTGPVSLIGDERDRPYERPPLSKGYLQGTTARDDVFVHPAGWYAEHDVDLRVATAATAIDRAAQEVVLAAGERLRYDHVLIATGSAPRHLDGEGAGLAGVHELRVLEQSDAIKVAFAEAGRGSRVAVVGGGWIGLETAATARAAGLEVTVLEQGELPLLRVLGPEMAQVFAELHRQNGVDLRCAAQVAALVGSRGRVSGVRLRDGTQVMADVVLVGVGVAPRTELAAAGGLDVDGGILVDEHLRTADPRVLAAGDVANAWHPVLGRRLRVEHWANARRQSAVAARTILGQDAVHDRLPYFFSDQYDLGMEYTGYAEPAGYDQVVVRGDLAARELVAFWMSGGRVVAGMNVNVWDVADQIAALITSGKQVDPRQLANRTVSLGDLAEG